MNHALRPWKQVSCPRKRMFTVFFNTRGPVVVDITPDKATVTTTYYTTSVLPNVLLHNQSTARTRRRSRIQLHHDNAAPHKARITQTYLDDNGSVWWNIHHSHPTWRRAISGSFQNSNLPLLGNLFQGPKTLLKLCIQIWGPYLIQSTENAFRSGGWGCNDV